MKKFTHKSVTKVLSFVLVVLMLFISFSAGVSALSTGVLTTNEDKLTDNLKTHLETVGDDEYVYIYIWLLDYSPNAVYQLLSKRLGTTITEQTEEAYITNRISSKLELFKQNYAAENENIAEIQADVLSNESISTMSALSFRAQASIAEAMSDTEIETCISSGMSATEIISLSERSQYLSDYRQSRKALNNAVTEDFFNKLDLSECRNVSIDPLLTRVTLECKKSYINNITSLSSVKEIGYFQNFIEILDTSNGNYFDNYVDYHMKTQSETMNYSGSGIRIGVVEATEGKYRYYDISNPHLQQKNISFRPSPSEVSNYEISTHSTKVLSILCGNPLNSNAGETYQGVAPNATVSLVNIKNQSEHSDAMNWLLTEQNVHIINHSAGVPNNGNYSSYSKSVDNYILEYRIIYVKSSGNNYVNVTEPGLAYNAITVGNCAQNESNEMFERVQGASSYDESYYLTNKPDLMASGTNVFLLDSSLTPTFLGSGTSFAAPMVAGAAALLMQANSYLTIRPNTVKAILLGTADDTAISAEITTDGNGNSVENNGFVSTATGNVIDTTKIQSTGTVLRERSGAGLLNIEAAIRMAQKDMFYSISLSDGEFISNEYAFYQGTNIEFGFAYQKVTDDILTSSYPIDVKIQIIDSNNNVVFESTDTTNNVEIFKCTIQSLDKCRFKIIVNNTTQTEIEAFNISMFVFCGCKEKSITQDSCGYGSHTLTCQAEGCGFNAFEIHPTIDLEERTLSNGITANGMISYLIFKDNVIDDLECFNVYLWVFPPSGSDMTVTLDTVPADYTIQTTNLGEVRKITYAILVTENGVTTRMLLPEITVTIYYSSRTATAYW